MPTLNDRRILVTGASSGIGEATARVLHKAGAQVALLARREDRIAALANELNGVAVAADVRDRDGVRDSIDQAADALGGLDGVVNNAGVIRLGGIADAEPEDWKLMLDTNVLGLLHVTHAAIPHLRAANGGDIVNVSSMSGRRLASPSSTVYSATKFAVHTISKGLRQELVDDHIRVSIVSPGYVKTPIAQAIPHEDQRDDLQERLDEHGLDVEVVADNIRHALAAPPQANVLEIAVLPTSYA